MKTKIFVFCLTLLFAPYPSHADITSQKIRLACQQLSELEIHFLDMYTSIAEDYYSNELKDNVSKEYFMDKLIVVLDLQNNLNCPSKWIKKGGNRK